MKVGHASCRRIARPAHALRTPDIELLLTAVGVLDRSQVPGEPTHIDSQFGRRTDEHGDGDAEPERQSTIRGGEKTQEEIDAELDWDL